MPSTAAAKTPLSRAPLARPARPARPDDHRRREAPARRGVRPAGARRLDHGTGGAVRLTPHDVHKQRRDALLLHTLRPHGTRGAHLTAWWPPSHPFYRCAPGEQLDAMLVLETLRQSIVATAHHLLDVSHDAAFVMNGIEVDVVPDTVLQAGGSPVAITLECSDVTVRDGVVRSVHAELEFHVDEEVVARGHGELVLLSPATYQRLRGDVGLVEHHSTLPRVDVATTGREHADDVVLSRVDERSWRLAVDTDHVHLFDHLYDHVPGMVILEAAQQAYGSVRPGRLPRSVRSTFTRYAEYHPGVTLHRTDGDSDGSGEGRASGVRLEVVQAGVTIATIELDDAS